MFKELNILKVFFEKPTQEFNIREAARLLKIAPATASKELKKLAKKRILTEKKERNLILYKSNIEDEHYQDLKIYYTIRKIKESGLIQKINKQYLKPTIILFGSTTQGLDTETSDIDILILTEKKEDLENKEEYEKKLNRKIQPFIHRTIKDIKNNHLINNILNGITLQGEITWT